MADLSRRQKPPGPDMMDRNSRNKNAIVWAGLFKKPRHCAIDPPIVLSNPDTTSPGLRVVINAVPIRLREHTVGMNARGKIFVDLTASSDCPLNARRFIDLGDGLHILEPVPDIVAQRFFDDQQPTAEEVGLDRIAGVD